MKTILVIAAIVLILAVIPFALIWGLNVLFPVLAIPYTLKTWAAMFLLGGVFTRTSTKGK